MIEFAKARRFAMAFAVCISVVAASGFVPETCPAAHAGQPQSTPTRQHVSPDHSGRARVGKASFYAKKFAGRKMANGRLMNPHGDNAASRMLPLGTKARVTNLETGQSAVVNIEDRGPYVKGRIIDLSPSTARKIGIDRKAGVAKVEVAPLTVPLPDGSLKAGAAARDMKAGERAAARGG